MKLQKILCDANITKTESMSRVFFNITSLKLYPLRIQPIDVHFYPIKKLERETNQN